MYPGTENGRTKIPRNENCQTATSNLAIRQSTRSGNRTRTDLTVHRILSPACLPIPPSGPCMKHNAAFHRAKSSINFAIIKPFAFAVTSRAGTSDYLRRQVRMTRCPADGRTHCLRSPRRHRSGHLPASPCSKCRTRSDGDSSIP